MVFAPQAAGLSPGVQRREHPISGQLSVVSGQWSVVSGQWSVVGCRLSVVGWQSAVGSRQSAVGSRQSADGVWRRQIRFSVRAILQGETTGRKGRGLVASTHASAPH